MIYYAYFILPMSQSVPRKPARQEYVTVEATPAEQVLFAGTLAASQRPSSLLQPSALLDASPTSPMYKSYNWKYQEYQ